MAVGTSKSLARDLVELGLPRRAVVIAHTSLKGRAASGVPSFDEAAAWAWPGGHRHTGNRGAT